MRGPQKRSSRLKFSCVEQARLSVARLLAGSIHHLAAEWVSQVRRPAKEDTTVSLLRRHGDAKPQHSNPISQNWFLVWFLQKSKCDSIIDETINYILMKNVSFI